MMIDGIEIYRVAMPLIYPFRTAFGDAEVVESVLVKMVSDDVEGWGEATPWASPIYSGEWAGGVHLLLKDQFGPKVVGKQIDSAAALQKELAPYKGNPFAKASLDLAWWDL